MIMEAPQLTLYPKISSPFLAVPLYPRKEEGQDEGMMFEINRLPPIFIILRMRENRYAFEVSLNISTVSFRAKARNLVSLSSFAAYFCLLDTQMAVMLFVLNDIVMRASLLRQYIRNLYCRIRNFVSLLLRPFSRREKDRMRERKYIISRSPIPALPNGEGVFSRLPGLCHTEENI